MALGFLGLTTAAVDVCLTFVVQGGVSPITPWCMSKGTGMTPDCWLVNDKLTVLTILVIDFDTLVTVMFLVANLALDALDVGDMTDSCER